VLINATLIVARLADGAAGSRAPVIAGTVVAVITLLYFVLRPQNVTEDVLASVEQA
jgi:hypothetical protein